MHSAWEVLCCRVCVHMCTYVSQARYGCSGVCILRFHKFLVYPTPSQKMRKGIVRCVPLLVNPDWSQKQANARDFRLNNVVVLCCCHLLAVRNRFQFTSLLRECTLHGMPNQESLVVHKRVWATHLGAKVLSSGLLQFRVEVWSGNARFLQQSHQPRTVSLRNAGKTLMLQNPSTRLFKRSHLFVGGMLTKISSVCKWWLCIFMCGIYNNSLKSLQHWSLAAIACRNTCKTPWMESLIRTGACGQHWNPTIFETFWHCLSLRNFWPAVKRSAHPPQQCTLGQQC